MGKLCQFLLFCISINLGVFQVSANVKNVRPSNSIGVERTQPPKTHPIHHPLPPVVMPGIVNDYEPSVVVNGKRKQFLTELRFLQNQMMNEPLTRKRRSIGHARTFPQALPMSSGSRHKRDLRRLRRDLGYDDPFLLGNDYARPSLVLTRKPEVQRTSPQYQRSTVPDQTQEVNRLLRGLDFLEHLARLTQSREVPPVVDDEDQRLYTPRAKPARFAPQPKVILDEDLETRRPLKPDLLANWERSLQPQLAPEPLYWVPEKRWSRTRPIESLSMMPGFKRSAFREATRTQREVQNEFEAPEENDKENSPVMMPIMDTEVSRKEKRIQRMAM